MRFDARAWEPAASDVRAITHQLRYRRPPGARLLAPVPLSGNSSEAIYRNSRAVAFQWEPTLRASSYKLHVGQNPFPKDDSNPLFRQTFDSIVTQHVVTFSED